MHFVQKRGLQMLWLLIWQPIYAAASAAFLPELSPLAPDRLWHLLMLGLELMLRKLLISQNARTTQLAHWIPPALSFLPGSDLWCSIQVHVLAVAAVILCIVYLRSALPHSHSQQATLVAIDSAARACAPSAGEPAPSGQQPAATTAAEEDEDGLDLADEDALSKMSARQRKLYELKQKLNQCRKANQTAVIAEKKRERVGALFLLGQDWTCGPSSAEFTAEASLRG